jgi:hypothetical protein
MSPESVHHLGTLDFVDSSRTRRNCLLPHPGSDDCSRSSPWFKLKGFGPLISSSVRFRRDWASYLLPGPGTHSPTLPVSGVAVTIRGRAGVVGRPEREWTAGPGPGQYDPEKKPKGMSVAAASLKFTEERMWDRIKDAGRPGPGDYSPALPAVQRGIRIGEGGRKGRRKGKETPGPGEYQPEKIGRKNFHIQNKIQNCDKVKVIEHTPGPGEYDIVSGGTPGISSSFKSGTDRLKIRIPETPGPGEYNIRNTQKHFNTNNLN